ALIVHCGGCMLNRREMQYRVETARQQGVAITNYGVLIAYVLGILPRALQPFPAARLALEK
ncbi:MAG TPA: [FeFe] hydrogenase H-cluster maturation GTPase HydF, partial [Clostridiales bacterium]|nr:[FeFe] hydrogenase H-cluster maturation GTPase HydF [Clostridiales bacterium]